jgi:hypothetical protein
MQARWIGVALAMGFAMTFAGTLSAQQRQTGGPALQPDPNLDAEDQLAPSQVSQPMPAAVPAPTAAPRAKPHAMQRAADDAAAAPAGAPHKPLPAAAGHTVISCSGPFAKDSGMLELAMTFDSRNMIFTEETVQGAKVGATVLFPKDPRRRLEVWWSNPNRTGVYLIDIAGKSIWTGPEGLRLGLTLEQLEKLNHRPFKLKGFDKDNVATVSGWDDGALSTLPGGCKSGVSLQPDPKVPADALSALSADHEYSSDDPAMRAAKPRVSEVLIGY